jgi:glutaredoxin
MLNSEEQRKRAEVIILILAKLYVVLELSPDSCPVCRKKLNHDAECPVSLAWSLLDDEQQHEARNAIRALALSLGCDESTADPFIH